VNSGGDATLRAGVVEVEDDVPDEDSNASQPTWYSGVRVSPRTAGWRGGWYWAVFQTARGPYRHGGDNAKMTGPDGTANRGPG